ncbi:MAG: MATE family efflux transporter [Bacteroidales bacterium]|nr:MATE family efflux transporter [Bacteroidales bacterium]MCI2122321.1 MATE family efflux transporter [Bacteroidales bacterium]MCI2145353.1 MATE family efflux transporter [Bacteroidales bacterium]
MKKYAVPAIIAMTASSLYNMVDSIYIGQGVGALAISGLAVTFPIMNLSTAVGTLVGVGASTMISILLGQKNYAVARRTLGNAVILSIVLGIIFQTGFLIFLDPILYFFGASTATIVYARDYMQVILYGTVVTFLYFALNNVVRTSGRPKSAMMVTLLTVSLNVIMDPIFIFGLKMGIRGAALATVLCQCISLIWICFILSSKKNVINFSKDIFRFEWKISERIFSIGMAPFLMNAAACFVVLLVNRQLLRFGGDLAIGAYGICNRFEFLFVMVTMGFTQGMQPIASYNYGAKLNDRVIEVLHKTIIYGTITMSAVFLIGELVPQLAVRMFTHDKELISKSVVAMRIMVAFMPVVGYEIVTSNFFQCIGMAKKAIFLSLSRQLIFLLPLLIVLPEFWGLNGVWWSMPISDAISSIVAWIMLNNQKREFNRSIKNGEASLNENKVKSYE